MKIPIRFFFAHCFLLLILCFNGPIVYSQFVKWATDMVPVEHGFDYALVQQTAIDTDTDGNTVILGYFQGRVDVQGQTMHTTNGTAYPDIFVAKFDTLGKLQWLLPFTGDGQDLGGGLKIDNNGDIVLSGSFQWGGDIAGHHVTAINFIAKLDASGNFLWAVPGNGRVIETDATNNVYSFYQSFFDSSVAKYSPDGGLLWENKISFDYNNTVTNGTGGIVVDSNGNVTVAGSFGSMVTVSSYQFVVNSESDLFFVNYDPDGNIKWAKSGRSLGLSDNGIRVHGLVADANNDLYLSGPLTQPYYRGGYVAKVLANGSLGWRKFFGSELGSAFIAMDSHSNIILSGQFADSIRYDNFNYYTKCDGSKDESYLMKVNSSNGSFLSFFASESNSYSAGIFHSTDSKGNIYATGVFGTDVQFDCVTLKENFDRNLYLFKIKEFPSYQNLFITSPPSVCAGTKVLIQTDSIAGASKYMWCLPASSTTQNGSNETSSPNADVNFGNDAGSGSIAVSATVGCIDYTSKPQKIQILPLPTSTSGVTGPSQVCKNQVNILIKANAQNASGYQWDLPAGITTSDNVNSQSDSLHINISDQFLSGQVQVKAVNICGVVNLVPLTIKSIPELKDPVVNGPVNICPNAVDSIYAVAYDSTVIDYTWSISNGLRGMSNNNSIKISPLQGFMTGYIQAKVTSTCGQVKYSEKFLLNAVPDPSGIDSLLGPRQICSDLKEIQFKLSHHVDEADTYQWTVPSMFSPSGVITTSDTVLILKPVQKGASGLSVVAVNKCKRTSKALTIDIQLSSPLAKPVLTRSDCDRKISFERTDSLFQITEWFNNNILIANAKISSLLPSDSGLYYVRIKDFCGSVVSDVIEVHPPLFDSFFIPNVITPNGDGKNDQFKIDKSLHDSELIILNRLGASVYETLHYHNDWSGDNLSPGVYYYLIRSECAEKPIKGWLQVIR